MTEILMPQMGESIAEGTITRWIKKVGDRVVRDEPLFEISTDKVDAEIPAPSSGVLSEIRHAEGETVPVNSVVAILAEQAGADAVAPVSAPTAAPSPAKSPMPPAAKAASPAPPSAVLRDVTAFELIEDEHDVSPASVPTLEPNEPSIEDLRRLRSSPVVRRIAAEHHVDIREIAGSGISGRVTKQDILAHLGDQAAAPQAPAPPPPSAAQTPAAPPSSPAPLSPPRDELIPMGHVRKRTAEHMLLSRRTSAHVTTVFEIDMTRVAQIRERQRQAFEARGAKLTFMPFILTATVSALKAHPVLNASINGDSIVYHRDINLGIAVAIETGLIVPVIHAADEKNVLGLARTVSDLADRARTKRLRVEEVVGGTFTVTNPGVFGSLFGTPIIHQPQVAILDVGTIEKRPVVRDDAIAIRTMAYFALTFDHRLVDGADADRFMAHLKKALEDFDEAAL